jgi:HTH-type transcriptional regulator/antitoxin HigA
MIRNEKEYDAALAHIDSLMSATAGTPEVEELELWTLLVKDYEEKHYPIDPPDAISAIRFEMDQKGLRQADLVPYIGSKSRVSEILSGRRALTLAMMRKLHAGLGIPLETLIREKEPIKKPARKTVKKQSPAPRKAAPLHPGR